jgi:hypothetical protein
MHVTTGGITYAVGTMMVVALAVTGVATLRDESDDTGSSRCEGQSEATAQKAMRAFEAEHVGADRASRRWFVTASTSRADLARRTIDSMRELPVSGQLPDRDDEGFIVVVHYNPEGELTSLPDCMEGTPILYVGSGSRLAG